MIPIPPEVLAALAAAYHLAPADLMQMGGQRAGADGTAFMFRHGDQARVFKVTAAPAGDPFSLLRLAERLKFAHYLGEHGAQVVAPLSAPESSGGGLFASAQHGEHTFAAYVMPYVPGRHPRAAAWTPDLLRAWGRLVGATHRITLGYTPWREVTAAGPQGQPVQVLGWEQEWDDFYNWCRDPQVKDFWPVIRAQLAALPIERGSFGFIHNDPHNENILESGGRLTLLDFDVANCHWFITDIAIALSPVLFRVSGGMDEPVKDLPAARRFLAHFMDGYAQENSLDPAWLEHLNLFINYRRALLFTVMLDWIETKPTLHHRWKKMILDETPVF